MNGQKKMLEFVFYLVLFIICIGLFVYNATRPKETTPPPPIPDPITIQTPLPAIVPEDGEAPPLLPQNIPYWELD